MTLLRGHAVMRLKFVLKALLAIIQDSKHFNLNGDNSLNSLNMDNTDRNSNDHSNDNDQV